MKKMKKMEKPRFKITLNWQGEIYVVYRHAASADQALQHAIRELARRVGYSTRFVKNYIMQPSSQRWEVSK